MKEVKDYIAYYYTEKGYNCAETILLSANDAWDLNLTADSIRFMGGFGGGMGSGIVCGAVSGSVAALSYRFVEESGHKSPLLMKTVRLFIQRVKDELGCENCKVLRTKYITKEERCLPTIRLVAVILDEVYEELIKHTTP